MRAFKACSVLLDIRILRDGSVHILLLQIDLIIFKCMMTDDRSCRLKLKFFKGGILKCSTGMFISYLGSKGPELS